MPTLSDNARRSRAYRQRRRTGSVVVSIEVRADVQKAMLDAHLIDPDIPSGRAAIADGIGVLLEFLRDGEITATVG